MKCQQWLTRVSGAVSEMREAMLSSTLSSGWVLDELLLSSDLSA